MWFVIKEGFGPTHSHLLSTLLYLFETKLFLSGRLGKTSVARPMPGGPDSTSSYFWSRSSPMPCTALSGYIHDLM